MRIISFNANGIRAAGRKGFFPWLSRQKADVVCIQETKAQREQLTDPMFEPKGYHSFYVDAVKKGYSGVALYCKQKPDRVIHGFKHLLKKSSDWKEFDDEGRYIEAQFGDLSVASIYLPSGSSGEHRQASKFRFLDLFQDELKAMKKRKREYVLCGDWNIAHKNIDLKNWRGNKKNSGFLPEERAWLDHLFDEIGFVDAFREVNKKEDQYTWWSNRGRARENNVGWRIDYHIVTPGLKDKVEKARVYTDKLLSDHAPLILDYDL